MVSCHPYPQVMFVLKKIWTTSIHFHFHLGFPFNQPLGTASNLSKHQGPDFLGIRFLEVHSILLALCGVINRSSSRNIQKVKNGLCWDIPTIVLYTLRIIHTNMFQTPWASVIICSEFNELTFSRLLMPVEACWGLLRPVDSAHPLRLAWMETQDLHSFFVHAANPRRHGSVQRRSLVPIEAAARQPYCSTRASHLWLPWTVTVTHPLPCHATMSHAVSPVSECLSRYLSPNFQTSLVLKCFSWISC